MITSPRFFWSGIFLGVIGCLFYANFREPIILFDSIPLFQLFVFVEQPILLPDVISEWIPSFLHIIGMSFFTAGIIKVNSNNYWKIPVAWLAIDLVFEGLQYYQTANILTWGNFEWVDIVAMFASTLITAIIFKQAFKQEIESKNTSRKLNFSGKSLASATAFGVGAFMMLGSYEVSNHCEFPDFTYGNSVEECEVEPIYLSWETIREGGVLLSDKYGENYQKQLKKADKTYTYKSLLLINETLSGVHIFDNSDPENPVYLDYISLLGNQDMAIKDQYLYLDSFTDLVVFDLADISAAPVRKTNVFIYPDPTDNLPSDLQFKESYAASKGLITGYINFNGDKFYFWPKFAGLEEL